MGGLAGDIDSSSGTVQAQSVDCRPVVDGDAVYVTTNSFVYSFNIRDGTRRWRYALGELTGGTSSPALAHHVIFFGAADGNVYAINA